MNENTFIILLLAVRDGKSYMEMTSLIGKSVRIVHRYIMNLSESGYILLSLSPSGKTRNRARVLTERGKEYLHDRGYKT